MEVQDQSRDKVETRLAKRQRAIARLYGVPCACPCNCRIRHRFGAVCVLCRFDDHWESLASYLEKIEKRQHQA